MEIFDIVPSLDARTHRKAATHQPDVEEPEYGRIRRVWDVEPKPLEDVKAERKAAATALRWEKETAGVLISGVPVATDDRSKMLILGKRAQAQNNPAMVFRWKAASGDWVDLTGAQIIAVADAVADHVQACFDREGELHDLIDTAPDAAAVLAVDIAVDWPA